MLLHISKKMSVANDIMMCKELIFKSVFLMSKSFTLYLFMVKLTLPQCLFIAVVLKKKRFTLNWIPYY